MKIKFSPEAQEDLDNIYHYYAELNETYAVELYNDIIDEADMLRGFPYIAQVEPFLSEFPEIYRSLVVHRTYKVVYFIEEDSINIVAVFDCRQNPQKMRKPDAV